MTDIETIAKKVVSGELRADDFLELHELEVKLDSKILGDEFKNMKTIRLKTDRVQLIPKVGIFESTGEMIFLLLEWVDHCLSWC